MQISRITIDTLSKKLALAAAAVIAVIFGAFAVIWGFANGAASQAEFVEAAEQAVSISPSDPQTNYAYAVLLDQSFGPGDAQKALAYYERAVSFAPGNYFYWLELGRAYERQGDAAKAESAVRHALTLAPNYSAVQWALGNLLIRQGRTAEAFGPIRDAVAGDPKFTETAASLAWQVSGNDIAAVKAMIGDSVRINAALASLLAKDKKYDAAVEFWNAIPPNERRALPKESANAFYDLLVAGHRYREAAKIAAELGEGERTQVAVGKIFNGGFESAVRPSGAPLFDWQLANGQNPQIVLSNGQKHSGSNSLLLVFNEADRAADIRRFSQAVAVEPGREYIFRYYYRTDLKTQFTFKWKIGNSTDGSPIAMSDPLPAKSEWAAGELRFTVPQNTDGIFIEFGRDTCSAGVCTAAGNIWFDDISLSEQ
ncbi:MAG: hypothetical protein QUS14_13165 [Pyrinomonadaceae bacterium]|nr:hypothetical protein [Pyrinomonadaceae bacterium]